MVAAFRNKSFDIDGVTWTEIVSPGFFNHFSILNDNSFGIKIRTDANDPDTEKAYGAGEEPFVLSGMQVDDFAIRYKPDDICCYVQAEGALDTGSVQVTFLK